jgi:TP901 family phage tail tape measure protein
MTVPQGGDQFSLGNAVGYVDMDTSRAITALTGLRGQMQSFFQGTVSGFQQMGATVSNFGSSLTLGMLPVAGAFRSGVSAAGNFQDALVEIQARTGATAEEMDKVRATALKLGADTVFSTQEAADAFLMLLTAGQDVNQALATLPQVLDGAAASGEDLGRTADFVTSTLASFSLAAEESQRVVDAMAKGAGASQATMGQMGEALQAVGGIAKQYGISLEDTSAIMAIFAQRGIRGAEAGTQLRSMLRNMTEPTATTQAAWEKLGVSLFDAEGNMRNLDVVLQEIEASLATKTQQEQIEIIQQIAGAYGQVGFSALLASDGIGAMRTQMDEQATAHEIAAARMATFKGWVESLRGSIEALLITAFTPYIEFLTPIIEQTVGIVNAFTTWIEANQAIVQPMLKVLSVLLILGPTLFVVGKAFTLVGFLIGALVSPVQLVLVAITALSMAWASNFANIRYWTQAAFTFVSDIIQYKVMPTVNALMRQFRIFGAMIGEKGLVGGLRFLFTTFDSGVSAISGLLRILGVGEERANAIGAAINQFMLPAINAVVAAFQTGHRIASAFTGAMTVFFNQIRIGVDPILALGWAFHSLARTLGMPIERVTALRIQFVDAMRTVQGVVSAAFGFVSRQIGRLLGFYQMFTQSLAQGQSFWDALRASLWNAGLDVNWFVDRIQAFATTIGYVVSTVVGAFVSGFKYFRIAMGLNLGVISALDWALQEFFSKLGVSGKIIQTVRLGLIRFGTAVQNVFGGIVSIGVKAFDSIRAGFRVFGASIAAGETWVQALRRAFMVIAVSLGVPLEAITSFKESIQGFFRVLGQIWNFIRPFVFIFTEWAGAVLGLNAAVAGIGIVFAAVGSAIAPVSSLIAGMLSPIGLAIGLIVLLANAYYSNFAGIRDFIDTQVAPHLMTFFGWLVTGIQSVLNGLAGLLNAFQTGGFAGAATFLQDNLVIPLMASIQSIDWSAISTGVLTALGNTFNTAVSWAAWVYDHILKPLWNNFTAAIALIDWAQVGSTILNTLGAALTTLGSWATWAYDNILVPLFDNLVFSISHIDWGQVGLNILSAIGTALSLAVDFVGWVYDNILLPMFNNAQLAIEQVDWGQVGYNIVNAIGAAIKATFDFILWIKDSLFAPMTENAEGASSGIDWSGVGSTIMNAIGTAITTVWNFIAWFGEVVVLPLIAGAITAIADHDWSRTGTGIMDAIRNALPNIGQWVTANIINPIKNALANFNPMSAVQGAGNAFSTGASNISTMFSQIGGALNARFNTGQVPSGTTIPGLASGTNLVPRDMLAILHEGEAVLPKAYNPAAGGTTNNGHTFNLGGVTVYANSRAEGEQAADGFKTRLDNIMSERSFQ